MDKTIRKLQYLNKLYMSLGPSEKETSQGWSELRTQLPTHQSVLSRWFSWQGIGLAACSGIALAILLTLAQSAKAGDFLYPVKVAGDRVVTGLSHASEIFTGRVPAKTVTTTPQPAQESSKLLPEALSPQISGSKSSDMAKPDIEVKLPSPTAGTSNAPIDRSNNSNSEHESDKIKGASTEKSNGNNQDKDNKNRRSNSSEKNKSNSEKSNSGNKSWCGWLRWNCNGKK